MRRLAFTVALTDNDGQDHTFGPTDDLPDWAAAQITNPGAWEGGEVPVSGAPERTPGVPPRGGAGSGKEAWAAYAASKDVQVPPDATRDDIVVALEAAGFPTE